MDEIDLAIDFLKKHNKKQIKRIWVDVELKNQITHEFNIDQETVEEKTSLPRLLVDINKDKEKLNEQQ